MAASAQGKPILVWLLSPRCLSADTALDSLWQKYVRGCQEESRLRVGGGQYGGSERKAGEAEASAVTYLQIPGEGALLRVMAMLLPPACLQ